MCKASELSKVGGARQHKLAVTDMGEFSLKGIKGKQRLFQCLPDHFVHRIFPKPTYHDTIPGNMLSSGDDGATANSNSSSSSSRVVWYEVVSKGKVSVRAAPHGDSEELGIIKTKDIVAASQTQGDWLFVSFTINDDDEKLVSGAASNAVNRKARGNRKSSSFSNDKFGLTSAGGGGGDLDDGDDQDEEFYIEGWALSRIARGDKTMLKECAASVQKRLKN